MIRSSLDAALAITDFLVNPDEGAELDVYTIHCGDGWCLLFKLPDGDARLTLDEAEALAKSLTLLRDVSGRVPDDAREFFAGVAQVGALLLGMVNSARAAAAVH